MESIKQTNNILDIVKLAFMICYYYIMKNFIQPIKLLSINTNILNYDNELINSINEMKQQLCDIKIEKINELNNHSKECDNSTYALKIKEIGRNKPDIDNYEESDIFVDIENKTINIKSNNKFFLFPLTKKSIIKTK